MTEQLTLGWFAVQTVWFLATTVLMLHNQRERKRLRGLAEQLDENVRKQDELAEALEQKAVELEAKAVEVDAYAKENVRNAKAIEAAREEMGLS